MLSIIEAQALLNLSEGAIYQLARSGELTRIKFINRDGYKKSGITEKSMNEYLMRHPELIKRAIKNLALIDDTKFAKEFVDVRTLAEIYATLRDINEKIKYLNLLLSLI